MRIPEIVAHRGYALHYPENTLPSLEAAIAAGARYVEVDIQLTRDGVPVLFHDRPLTRVCGVPGMIHEYTAAELAAFHASEFDRFGYRYAQVPIATLAQLTQLLRQHPGVTGFIELKRVSIERFGVDAVLDAVNAALKPAHGQCVLISYHIEALARARGRTRLPVGAVFDRWREHRHAAIRDLKPEYVFSDADCLPRLGRLKAGGARIAIYEVRDPALGLRLAARGVDLVETFAFSEMRSGMELLAAA